jgi:hypothetical protein
MFRVRFNKKLLPVWFAIVSLATFEVKDPALKPLPIMGMFYCWGVDLCKIPTISKTGGKNIVVMIEHFLMWVELRAIPEKTSEYIAAALTEVLTHYGAPVLRFLQIKETGFKVNLLSC